jgi:hypothetical protein
MGYNSTLIVLNDALHQISEDKDFGKKVADAISHLQVSHGEQVGIHSGGHCNAATAVESHHADGIKLIAIGGNCAQDLGYVGGYRSSPLDMLESLADSLGYSVVKKKVKTKCSACNGSGYYDNTGNPPCGCCNGKGFTTD